jgi:hypothetical protein
MNTVRKKQQVAGSTLKRKRRSLGLSVAEASLLLCVPESTYRFWEKTSGGIEAIPFASGDWDKTVAQLSCVKSLPFLECVGKLHAALTEENQAHLTAMLDNLATVALTKFFANFKG